MLFINPVRPASLGKSWKKKIGKSTLVPLYKVCFIIKVFRERWVSIILAPTINFHMYHVLQISANIKDFRKYHVNTDVTTEVFLGVACHNRFQIHVIRRMDLRTWQKFILSLRDCNYILSNINLPMEWKAGSQMYLWILWIHLHYYLFFSQKLYKHKLLIRNFKNEFR